ncbi:MAG TPA: response regulator transcription factor [Longimicrobiaceae bacterium]|nr:response regulator transcription factor [Longimicrobiaceae bacterium]
MRLVLADDHLLLLQGLRAVLEAEDDMVVVGTATTGEQFLEAVRLHRPDVAVLDLTMEAPAGLECLERLRTWPAPPRILVLTAHDDAEWMRAALEKGASGYVLKTEPPRHTVAAIRQVYHGQLVFPLTARSWLLGGKEPLAEDPLTERERTVLALLAEGLSNAQIAQRLRLKENTIKYHLQNVYLKLRVSNRTEAAAYFHRTRSAAR